MKKYISYLLSATLLAGTFVNGGYQNVKAKVSLSNPIVNDNGIATWDCVYFGNYPQSDGTGLYSEPVKWRVLSVSNDEAFLVADCNLDVYKYNDSFASTTWEESSIRTWLNDYFYNKAFSIDEKQYIIDSKNINDIENSYGILGGNDTTDKVFLLSESELTNSEYGFCTFDVEDLGRIRRNTAYVANGGSLAEQGANPYGENQADSWWTRTSGEQGYKTAFVNSKGVLVIAGDTVNLKNCMICPAIRIDVDSNQWEYAGTVDSNGNIGVAETETSTEEICTSKVLTEETTEVTIKDNSIEEYTTINRDLKEDIETTKNQNTDNSDSRPENSKVKLGRTKIVKVTKKKKAKTVRIKLKKIKKADRYEISFSTKKSFKKVLFKKIVKQTMFKVKNKKLTNKKQLYVRARAILVKGNIKYTGRWSKVKKVKIS